MTILLCILVEGCAETRPVWVGKDRREFGHDYTQCRQAGAQARTSGAMTGALLGAQMTSSLGPAAGSMVYADAAERRVFNECMTGLGWEQVKVPVEAIEALQGGFDRATAHRRCQRIAIRTRTLGSLTANLLTHQEGVERTDELRKALPEMANALEQTEQAYIYKACMDEFGWEVSDQESLAATKHP